MSSFRYFFIRFMLLFLSLQAITKSHAQKQYFKEYNIEQGLGQSQVTAICQDTDDNLWIATLGGISKFDGKTFTNYSETDGLVDNYTNCIYADRKKNIWVGTRTGLSRLTNSKFINYRFHGGIGDNFIRNILEDKNGQILVLTSSHVYAFRDSNYHLITVDKDSSGIIMSMMIGQDKRLWMTVRHKGIYCLENDHWVKKANLANFKTEYFNQIISDPWTHDVLLLTTKKLFTLRDTVVQPADRPLPSSANYYISLFFDKNGEAWFVAGTGIYHLINGEWLSYNTGNGYTNIPTACIMQDHENSIWLGTSGAGIFQFNQQPYFNYDQFSGADAIVMHLIGGNHEKLYIGTDGSGMYSFENNNFRHFDLPSPNKIDQEITSMCRGNNDDLMLSTKSNTIWKFHDNHFEQIWLKGFRSCINGLHVDDSGKLWICACDGIYHYQNGNLTRINSNYTSKVFFRPGYGVMAAFYMGLAIIHPDGKNTFVEDSLIWKAHIMNIIFKGAYYVIATSNRGLLIYDTISKKTKQYTVQNGLNSNFVYSMVEDKNGMIWLGTGHGLNKIILDTLTGLTTLTNEAGQGDISSGEYNEDAAFCSEDNMLWFGAARGLMKFRPVQKKTSAYMPPLMFKSRLPDKTFLSHNENHISFDFNCASYNYSDQIAYQYHLNGTDLNYSEPTSAQQVIYSQLPPGKYLFSARAVNRQTGIYSNTISYAFEVRPAFYQTLLFKIILFSALAVFLFFIIRYLSLRKEKKYREIETIKQNEQIKLRQQAAEDFHDEMGNTITRIQLLSDVVRSKLLKGDTDVGTYIDRIKDNVSLLYQGTRDIIWALSPKSDRLDEIIHRLTTTGSELFFDTGVVYSNHNQVNGLEAILPGHTGRNIILIFKEAMNNILKHAKATRASLSIEKKGPQILIILRDDGNGFIADKIKKGYGTVNMAKRAERIDGLFTIESCISQGTVCRLVVNIPGIIPEKNKAG
jgi:signal transduction histidine kinase/ligand-binding sensor domain-containing protein